MERKLRCSKGKEILVDDIDYDKLKGLNWNSYNGYARTYHRKDGKFGSRLMHRMILGVTDSKVQVDHVNGNGLDNRRVNLRLADSHQNGCNRKVGSNSTTGHKGVAWHVKYNRYQASIKVMGKRIYLGYYDTVEDASRAYNDAADRYHKDFARLNRKKVA